MPAALSQHNAASHFSDIVFLRSPAHPFSHSSEDGCRPQASTHISLAHPFRFLGPDRRRTFTQTILRRIVSMDGVLKWDNLTIYYGSKIENVKGNTQQPNIYVKRPESSI